MLQKYSGIGLLLILLVACCGVSAANELGDRKGTENEYIKRLENDLKSQERMIADMKKRKIPDAADMFAAEAKLIKEQLAEARQLAADGKEFGQAEYLEMEKERRRASDERFAREKDESKKQLADAAATRDAEMEKARSQLEDAQKSAWEKYHGEVGAADLLRKFQTSGGQLRVVIWNLPLDEALGKRSTSIVNVTLLAGKEVAWQWKGVKLDRRQAVTEIPLPAVLFDKVTIDCLKWSGDGAGLAEVQVFVGNENVAEGKPCTVSSIDTLPQHLDDENAVTDGVMHPTKDGEGYWIAEEKKKASVTIDLLGKTREVEKEKSALPVTRRPGR